MVKNLPASSGGAGSIPESGGSPGGGNDNPLQYSCLENPMERGAWWATIHSHKESDTTEVTYHTEHRAINSIKNKIPIEFLWIKCSKDEQDS